MHFQLAWRNIWRNPRRTAVILIAVVIGVWSMVFLGALMVGVSDQMVRNSIATLTGSLQIHSRGYRADPVIDHSMDHPGQAIAVLEKTLPDGAEWTTRVRVHAVASNARHSSGVTLVGIDPAREAAVSFIGGAVDEGRYLEAEEPYGILVGRTLVENYETRLGHKLVLMSEDAAGEIASRAFRIAGVYKAELAATEKRFVFVTKAAAQEMLGMNGAVSEIVVLLPDPTRGEGPAAALRSALSNEYAVHTWRELLPLVEAYLEINRKSVAIWYFVVFIAMGFGIVNTMLMAVYERIREFGLLKALGMKPGWIIRGVVTESFLVLLIGILAGNCLALSTVLIVARTGIDLSVFAAGAEFAGMPRVIYPVLKTEHVTAANLVVLVLGLIVSLYPALKAARFTPVKALAHT
jgi:ABC-type lipoprotein release transport system permease subunit